MKFIVTKLKSEVIRNFLIYSFGALFLKGVSFFLIPLYTRLLTPEEYGYLDLLSTFASILEVVLSLGLAQVFFMEFFQVSQEKRIQLLNKILSVYFVLSTSLYILTFVFILFSYDSIFPGIDLFLIVLVMLTTYLTFFQGLLILIFKLSSKAFRVTIIQVAFGLISVFLNILFVYFLKSGYAGVIWAGAISMGFSTLYGIYVFKKRAGTFQPEFNLKEVKGLLKFGIPFIPNTLSFWLMNSANRWILLHYSGGDQVGFFSLAMKFGALFDPLLIQPFLSSYSPRILKKFGEGDFNQPLKWLFLGAIGLFLIAGFVLQFIAGYMIDSSFSPALPLIPIVIMGFAFNFMAQSAALILVFRKRVNTLLMCILTGGCMSVLMNLTLIPDHGSMGSAVATVSGNLCWLLMILYFVFMERKKLNNSISVS